MDIKSNKEFQEIKEAGSLSLVNFTGSWCPSCQRQAPIVSKVKEDLVGQVDVYKVDIDTNDNRDIANELGIRGIPTIAILKNKQVVELLVGLRSEEQLLEVLKKHS